ncbi:nuclear transport factor 2 family protein [Streptomyces sp. ATCC51928]|uniref:Nuclear transport factor 2 family protein n=1 Tax=Streptomyces caviscabies TaxID=90079 RepID=A0ABW2ME14_9ACTN|nr:MULTISPECIES: nuclear transport factor 2 family protein [unclassified Streptomyces]MDX3502348.1 nuclear transport factor 2 family protein [Streptomyces sp. ATCC51928]MDX5522379.1 nuclear transport factor 2 family protein [Streptomyces sp. DE06-01C]
MTHSPTTDSRAVLTAMYTAEARYLAAGGPGTASFDLLAPCFAPDVVLHQAAALPYGGVWRGHRGMERFFLAMSDIWAMFELVEQDFLATGEIPVVHTIVRARSRATRRELTFPVLQTLTVRDGRISEIRPFSWDTDAVVRACAP